VDAQSEQATYGDAAAAGAGAEMVEGQMSLQQWMDQLCKELGVDPDVDTSTILDLARDAAHMVDRPAAPLTTFVVGYAAALRGGSSKDIADCSDTAADLAAEWSGDT
jgi:hypothetical protein